MDILIGRNPQNVCHNINDTINCAMCIDCAFLHVWDVCVRLLQEEEWKEVEEEREKDYSGLRISNLQIQYGFLYIAAYTQWEIHHIIAVMHITCVSWWARGLVATF